MRLTGQEILDRGIIIPSEYTKAAQVGVDLSLKEVYAIVGVGNSIVGKEKTVIDPDYFFKVKPEYDEKLGITCWNLNEGTYSIVFNEGCNIPANCSGELIHRSSIYRLGNMIVSPLWDPGYKTEQMATTLIVTVGLSIEVNARICQAVFHTNIELGQEHLYNGQFQGGTTNWEKSK